MFSFEDAAAALAEKRWRRISGSWSGIQSLEGRKEQSPHRGWFALVHIEAEVLLREAQSPAALSKPWLVGEKNGG